MMRTATDSFAAAAFAAFKADRPYLADHCQEWKDLCPAERQRYVEIAQASVAAYQAH